MTIHYLIVLLGLRDADTLPPGTRPGVTAMAAGLKHVAGLGRCPLRRTDGGGGLRISGPIRWASNVFHDALIVLPARPPGRPHVVAVDADADGVSVDPAPTPMALGATASTSLRLEDVAITRTG